MMKPKYCFAMVMAVIGLSACAITENSEGGGMSDSMEATKALPSTGDITEFDGATSADAGNIGEISYEAAVVPYVGEAFAKSVFAAGGDMLYLCGIKSDGTYFMGRMEEEQDVFQEFEIPAEEGMRVTNMTVDGQGNCHILLMSVEQVTLNGQAFDSVSYEKSYIIVVNRDGEPEKEIDVTGIFADGYKRPHCLVTDDVGNYYLENGRTMVQILTDGTLGKVLSCEGEIEGIGRGKSGAIYSVYYSEAGECVMVKLEEEGFAACGVTLPDSDAIYSGLYPGTDAELLVFSKSNGITAYEGIELQTRVSSSDMPVTGETISGEGMMADGRLCILAETEGTQTFYYIPTVEE